MTQNAPGPPDFSQTVLTEAPFPFREAQVEAIYKRCVHYFDDLGVAYRAWFKRPEWIIQPLDGASYLDGSACHLDLVQWATDPVWSGITDREVGTRLASEDLQFLLGQLAAPQLEIAYLNGAQVAKVLGSLIPRESRRATFRDGNAGFSTEGSMKAPPSSVALPSYRTRTSRKKTRKPSMRGSPLSAERILTN